MEKIQLVLDAIGAISLFCGALSHVVPGELGEVLGEIGLDIAGFIKAVRK